jgi:hypothetical protein
MFTGPSFNSVVLARWCAAAGMPTGQESSSTGVCAPIKPGFWAFRGPLGADDLQTRRLAALYQD